MTLAEIRTQVQNAVGTVYTATQIDAAVNAGLRIFSLITLCVERTALIKWQPNTPIRPLLILLEDFLLPLHCRCHVLTSDPNQTEWDTEMWDQPEFDQLAPDAEFQMTPMRAVRLQDLNALDPAWRAARNSRIERYGCLGLDQFFVYPAPSEIGTTIEITYAAVAATLVNASDIPEIPLPFHQALVHFAIATIPMDAGGSELASVADEWDLFLEQAGAASEWVRARHRTLSYDRMPFELVAWDRSRKAKQRRRQKAA